MTQNKITTITVVTHAGDHHVLNDISEMRMSLSGGLLDIDQKDGKMVFPFDRVCYFSAELETPASKIRFSSGDVRLSGINGKPGENIHIRDIINCEWKSNHGFFMVSSKTATYGFHLDHLVSYQMMK